MRGVIASLTLCVALVNSGAIHPADEFFRGLIPDDHKCPDVGYYYYDKLSFYRCVAGFETPFKHVCPTRTYSGPFESFKLGAHFPKFCDLVEKQAVEVVPTHSPHEAAPTHAVEAAPTNPPVKVEMPTHGPIPAVPTHKPRIQEKAPTHAPIAYQPRFPVYAPFKPIHHAHGFHHSASHKHPLNHAPHARLPAPHHIPAPHAGLKYPVPKFEAPKLPKFEIPKFEAPKLDFGKHVPSKYIPHHLKRPVPHHGHLVAHHKPAAHLPAAHHGPHGAHALFVKPGHQNFGHHAVAPHKYAHGAYHAGYGEREQAREKFDSYKDKIGLHNELSPFGKNHWE